MHHLMECKNCISCRISGIMVFIRDVIISWRDMRTLKVCLHSLQYFGSIKDVGGAIINQQLNITRIIYINRKYRKSLPFCCDFVFCLLLSIGKKKLGLKLFYYYSLNIYSGGSLDFSMLMSLCPAKPKIHREINLIMITALHIFYIQSSS